MGSHYTMYIRDTTLLYYPLDTARPAGCRRAARAGCRSGEGLPGERVELSWQKYSRPYNKDGSTTMTITQIDPKVKVGGGSPGERALADEGAVVP